MNEYRCSKLAREMYQERVREALGQDADDGNRAACTSTSTTSRMPTTGQPRFQTAVRWLIVGLFVS